MAIEWRDISGYPQYKGSSTGVIMSYKRCRPKALKPETDKDGYKRVTLCDPDGKKKHYSVHTLVLRAFKGDRPSDLHVSRHLNDTPGDNSAENLVWGTVLENVEDRDNHDRTCKGSKQHLSKLNENDIPIIRELIRQGKTDAEIAGLYCVIPGTIWFIRRGITWKHCQ